MPEPKWFHVLFVNELAPFLFYSLGDQFLNLESIFVYSVLLLVEFKAVLEDEVEVVLHHLYVA